MAVSNAGANGVMIRESNNITLVDVNIINSTIDGIPMKNGTGLYFISVTIDGVANYGIHNYHDIVSVELNNVMVTNFGISELHLKDAEVTEASDTPNVFASTLTYTTQYRYNLDNQLTQIIYPHGLVIHYHYNSTSGKLESVTTIKDGQTITLASNIGFLPFGPLKTLSYGNGFVRTLNYDQNYRLRSISTPGLQEITHIYSSDSSIESLLDNVNLSFSQSFQYDPTNRLTDATGHYGELGYSYDDVGNRLSRSQDGGISTYDYIEGTQKLDTITGNENIDFTVDAVGNITHKGGSVFAYNQQNRLVNTTVNGVATEYGANVKSGVWQKTQHPVDQPRPLSHP